MTSLPDIHALEYLWIEKQRRDRRQQAIMKWGEDTFGGIEGLDVSSIPERLRRYIEESLELCQSLGMTHEEVDQVAAYVFAREPGNPFQEFGGTSVTLNMLAEAANESLCGAEVAEWERVQSKTKVHFEARHRAKMEQGI